ncbi:MAG: glutamate 5-kinase [Candidatus Omnitrophica bacterium]|nr:glutamate 5-kinase [Candidatus Omnitrophota bacterium]
MKKIVVKVGSSIIAPSGKLNNSLVEALVKDVLETQKLGSKVVLVTSGAIACGADKLKFSKKPSDTAALMALASVGQIILMDAYTAEFKKHKRACAQILLTWDDFDNRKRFLNAKNTINKLLSLDITPIINENDAISFDEIKFGDNDRLSALVGDLVRAQTLLILSDVEGLMDKGKIINTVPKIDEKISSLVTAKNKAFTSGGMLTKLEAGKIATCSGITMIIASGHTEGVISRIAKGEDLGTTFLAQDAIGKARKRWIAFSKKVKGKIYVDNGAKEAILNAGRSLLCVGITKTEQDFKRGDSVEVLDESGKVLGCGLVNYSSEELANCRTKKFEKEVIHRNNFVKKQ